MNTNHNISYVVNFFSRRVSVIKPLFIILLLSVVPFSSLQANDKQLTSSDCMSCHQSETEHWQKSDHAMAMALPNKSKVSGDFNNQVVKHYTQQAKFFIEDGLYKATIIDLAKDKSETFDIKYTFGHYPLQQYLVETKPGSFHVLPFAWDARTKEEGGQRWYHNYEESITSADRLHWRQPLQNWNGMCADCHSDELVRNYKPETNSFDTQYTGINVACVSCHGVMDGHLNETQNGQASIAQSTVSQSLGKWMLSDKRDTAMWQGPERDNAIMQTCFACHSLRSPLTDGFVAEKEFLDQFSPNSVMPPLYFADGQIKEEVYVYGSFLQSKMYANGVNCLDCHNPHTMKVKIEGNGLCLQCHKASTFDTEKHHKHEAFTEGAQCVNCHMPDRVYMGVDNRRDHSFKIPRPDLSMQFDTPNACMDCHAEKGNQWAVEAITDWYGKPEPLNTNKQNLMRLRHGQLISLQDHLAIANDSKLTIIDRASAIELLPRSTQQLEASSVINLAKHKEDLIRLAVARVASLIEPQQRIKLIAPLLKDKMKSIRAAAALSLVALDVGAQNSQVYARAFNELLVSNEVSAWRGEGRVNQGNIAMLSNDLISAETAYKATVDIDPYFEVGYMNLADLYRNKQREDMVESVLTEGLEKAPQSADVAYAYGLHLVRVKKLPQAITYFEQAMQLNPINDQLAYTFVLALDGNNQTDLAITQLKSLINNYANKTSLKEMGLYLARKTNSQQDFIWFNNIR